MKRKPGSQVPLAITISRQLGSGGAYIGQQIARALDINYVDRDIISQVAGQFMVLEEEIEARDEKITSLWQSFLQLSTLMDSVEYIPPQFMLPTDKELFKAESDIIRRMAWEHSSVFIGRCGHFILRDHPNHIRIFLHGSLESRISRVQGIYHVRQDAAVKMINDSDARRARYNQTISGKEWTDARQYSLSIDTGCIAPDQCVEYILSYIEGT